MSKRRRGRTPHHARTAGGYRLPTSRAGLCSYPGFDCDEVALDGWVYCAGHHAEVERVALDIRWWARSTSKKKENK